MTSSTSPFSLRHSQGSQRQDMPDQQQDPRASPAPSQYSGGGLAAMPFDAEIMQEQMDAFVRDGLVDSAQLLGEFLAALANVAASGGSGHGGNTRRDDALRLPREFHGTSYQLFADLLVLKREFKRAIQYYKRSWKMQIGVSNSSSSPEAVALKTKIAQCWIELDGTHQAIEVLNSVPAPSRTLKINLVLGKLYLGESLKKKAEESYRAALRQNPYALEAALALAEIAATRESTTVAFPSTTTTGPTNYNSATAAQGTVTDPAFWHREVERFVHKLASTSSTQPNRPLATVDAGWLQTLVNAHIHAHRGRYRLAVECFDELDELFPNNLHALLHKGKLEMEQDFFHQAHLHFHRARQIDDQNLALMDAHADCLRKNGARIQLHKLVHDLFDTSDAHVACWLAAAYLSEMKGELDAALQLSERAIHADRRYAPAHLFRGALLLQLHRPEHALLSFTSSCKWNKTLEAYAGIIVSYCDLCMKGLNKYKEALTTAKTVVKLYPHKAQSYTLLGNVFALRPENAEQAKKAYARALSIEPRKLAAVFGWAELLVRDGCVEEAIDRLSALAEQSPREEVFTKLADVYTLNKQFGEAMTFYHRALSINSASHEAARGLERLEKIMRGEDPDEVNSTLDHMEGDEQDDSMDAGEYAAS